jgi:cbb3-type cytochrome oxidase subunit 3
MRPLLCIVAFFVMCFIVFLYLAWRERLEHNRSQSRRAAAAYLRRYSDGDNRMQ